MKKEPALDLSARINALHEELVGYARTSLETAIKIGGLLTEQKAALKHGQWLPWCEESLAFNERTAQRYMRLFDERAKFDNVSDLSVSQAYRELALVEPTELWHSRERNRRDRHRRTASRRHRLLFGRAMRSSWGWTWGARTNSTKNRLTRPMLPFQCGGFLRRDLSPSAKWTASARTN